MRPPLDTTLFVTFMAVAETGGFSSAGERLGCVQSNVTARIRRLEDHLGGRLFERGRNGAALTAFGRLAHERVRKALDTLSSLERELIEASGGSAPLRLGAMETTAAARLPKLMAKLRKQCPDATVTLQTGPTARLLDMVWNRQLDAAFVAGPIDPDRFHAVSAFNEQLFAFWRTNILSKETQGHASPLSDTDTLLAFSEGCSYRASAQAWLREKGHADIKVMEMGSLDAMIGCAAAGMGMVVVPKAAARRIGESKQLAAYALPAEFGEVTTHLVSRHDEKPVRALKILTQFLSSRV